MNSKVLCIALIVVAIAQASPVRNVFPKFEDDIDGPIDYESDSELLGDDADLDLERDMVDEEFSTSRESLVTPRTDLRAPGFPTFPSFATDGFEKPVTNINRPSPGFATIPQNTEGLLTDVTTQPSTTVRPLTQIPTNNSQSLEGLAGLLSTAVHEIVNENANNLNIAVDSSLDLAQAFVRFTNIIVAAKIKAAMSIPRLGHNFYQQLEQRRNQ